MSSNLWQDKLKPFKVALLNCLFVSLKSLFWTILTTIAGLFQIVLILCICQCINDIPSPFNEIIMSCILLFFSTSLIASMAIDYLFNKIPMQIDPFEIFVYIIIPAFYILVCTIIYTLIFLADIYKSIHLNEALIKNGQLMLFFFILLYAFLHKCYTFNSNQRRQ